MAMADKPDRRYPSLGVSTLAPVSLSSAIIGLLVVPMAIFHVIPGRAGFLVFPAEILAIVTGHIARRRIGWTGYDGEGVALAGLLIGYGFFLLSIVAVCWLLMSIDPRSMGPG
jgi:hypothetical protein